MDSETQKIIADQMKKLPKDVLNAIISVDYKTKLQEVTRRQKLLIDQAGKLEMETTLVMIGLEPLADYVNNLQRELDVSVIKAKEIALDVSENIFKPIRESLYKMNGGEEEAEQSEIGLETEVRDNTLDEMQGAVGTDNNKAPEENNLDRNKILNEIEDPSLIGREIETLAEVPYQQDIKIGTEEVPKENLANTVPEKIAPRPSLLETKMADITITSQKIVEAAPENKLPPIEKKKPFGGVDPYREEIK